jgi:hypothetical protein
VTGEDAHTLVREFATSGEGPVNADTYIVPAAELQNLPDYMIYVRTLRDGAPKDPFRVTDSGALSVVPETSEE